MQVFNQSELNAQDFPGFHCDWVKLRLGKFENHRLENQEVKASMIQHTKYISWENGSANSSLHRLQFLSKF